MLFACRFHSNLSGTLPKKLYADYTPRRAANATGFMLPFATAKSTPATRQTHCRSIHSIRKSTIRDWRSGGISVPGGTFHHLAMQPRQQHAQACCALKTGCPRMGVCLPSFSGCDGASFVRTKSSACRRIVSIPFSAMYFLSDSERRNRDLNLDLPNLAKAASCAPLRMLPTTIFTFWKDLPGSSCCGGFFRRQIPLCGSRRLRRTTTTACRSPSCPQPPGSRV